MNYYSYDPETGEYRFTREATENPKTPGEYLLPAHATFETPPELKEHEANVWNGSAWEIVADFRGMTVYSIADGRPLTVGELGPLPSTVTPCECPERLRGWLCWDGAAWVPDNAKRPELLQLAAKKIDQNTAEQLAAGVEFNGARFPLTGELYAQNMAAASAYVIRGQTAGRNLYTLTGSYILVTDIAGLVAAGDDQATSICMSGAEAKDRLTTKTTEELIAFLFPAV